MTMQTAAAVSPQGLISRALWHNRVLVSLVILHLCSALITCYVLDVPFDSGTIPTLITLLKTLVPLFVIFLMFWRFGYMAMVVRPARPSQWFIADIRENALNGERLANGVVGFLAISVFAGTFAVLKDLVPLINPFSWDPYFAQLDQTLHGGYAPYELLMPLLGSPLITTIINAAYHFWFFLLYFIVFMTSFDRDNAVRRNSFLIAMVLTWVIGGNLLAAIFSSAGPVYYEVLGYGSEFVPLLDKLHEFAEISPVWALDVHAMLIDGYLNDGPVKGISAMPSMHVASAVMMACFGFSWRKWAGWLLVAFAIVIQLGSVHLAWHYAIDGYFGAIIGLVCWYVACKLAEWQG